MTLAAWCDGLLSQADREAIDVHVAACPRCADIVALVESDIAGDAAGPSLRIELEPTIDRAAKLVLAARGESHSGCGRAEGQIPSSAQLARIAADTASLHLLGLCPSAHPRSPKHFRHGLPGRHSWRFIATRFSGIAAALLFAVLGGWIGMRLAMRLNTTSDRSDSTMASLSYGIVDDLDRELDASGDPLELVATQLFDGSTS